jgi:hypothetical protein
MSLMDVVISVVKDGKKLEHFKGNLPNIRSLQGYLKGIWDFTILNDSFAGRNKLSDVDGSIELNGHTLMIEFKGARNGMNKGQVLKAIRQAKYSNITTMFIFGATNKPEAHLTIRPNKEVEAGYTSTGYVEADLEGVRKLCKDWSDWTKENSLVKNKTAEWEEVSKVMGELYQ